MGPRDVSCVVRGRVHVGPRFGQVSRVRLGIFVVSRVTGHFSGEVVGHGQRRLSGEFSNSPCSYGLLNGFTRHTHIPNTNLLHHSILVIIETQSRNVKISPPLVRSC